MIRVGENYVAVPASEFEKVKSVLPIFYGVEAVEQDSYVYLIPRERSGVLPEYREAVKQLLVQMGFDEGTAQALAEHNQLQLVTLAAVLAAALGLTYYYRDKIEEQLGELGEYFWKVVLPILTFGLGAWVAYNALGG